MKKLIAILSIAAIAATAHAQNWTMPNLAYFNTNVFLHDAPTVPLHTRVPTGAVAQVVGNVLYPVGNLSLHGNLTVETNRTFAMSYKPDVSDVTNSVVIDANGQIILRRWVTGTGWIEATINPTNPLPSAMMASGVYVPTSTWATADSTTNYMDRTSDQAVHGSKTFTSPLVSTNGIIAGTLAVAAPQGPFKNVASGANSAVLGGGSGAAAATNIASGAGAVIVGGGGNLSSGNFSAQVGGFFSTNTAIGAIGIGSSVVGTSQYSVVLSAGNYGDRRESRGDNSVAMYGSGGFYFYDGTNVMIIKSGVVTLNGVTLTWN